MIDTIEIKNMNNDKILREKIEDFIEKNGVIKPKIWSKPIRYSRQHTTMPFVCPLEQTTKVNQLY